MIYYESFIFSFSPLLEKSLIKIKLSKLSELSLDKIAKMVSVTIDFVINIQQKITIEGQS